jgi:nitrite reductase (NADH) small subunit
LTDENVVICPLHGNTYDLATGAQVGGSYSVCTYPVSAGPDGSILLDGQPKTPA